MEHSKLCFIITPYDGRGNDVFEMYIKKACDDSGYKPERADEQLTRNILDGIETSLSVCPMVIAYLGEGPNYSDNVIFEIGYRFSTKRPLVILSDEAKEDQLLTLPFHLNQERIILIPHDKPSDDFISSKIHDIVKQIKAMETEPTLESTQPIATIQCYGDHGVDIDKAFFSEASALALKLFGKDLLTQSLRQFYESRKNDMPDYQYEAFMYDQRLLLSGCGVKGLQAPIIAGVPMIFKEGNFAGRAFLPIIARTIAVGSIKELLLLYLDVTSISTKSVQHQWLEDIKYYPCALNPWSKPIKEVIDELELQQSDVGVFLAHRSIDKEEYVKPIYEMLKKSGGRPWLDEEQIKSGEHWPTSISDAIKTCKVAIVFISKDGLGPFQELEVPALISEHMKRGISIISVFLPGVEISDDIFLRQFQGRTYDEIKKETNINEIVKKAFPNKAKNEKNKWWWESP